MISRSPRTGPQLASRPVHGATSRRSASPAWPARRSSVPSSGGDSATRSVQDPVPIVVTCRSWPEGMHTRRIPGRTACRGHHSRPSAAAANWPRRRVCRPARLESPPAPPLDAHPRSWKWAPTRPPCSPAPGVPPSAPSSATPGLAPKPFSVLSLPGTRRGRGMCLPLDRTAERHPHRLSTSTKTGTTSQSNPGAGG
jgi:hypothetical protein